MTDDLDAQRAQLERELLEDAVCEAAQLCENLCKALEQVDTSEDGFHWKYERIGSPIQTLGGKPVLGYRHRIYDSLNIGVRLSAVPVTTKAAPKQEEVPPVEKSRLAAIFKKLERKPKKNPDEDPRKKSDEDPMDQLSAEEKAALAENKMEQLAALVDSTMAAQARVKAEEEGRIPKRLDLGNPIEAMFLVCGSGRLEDDPNPTKKYYGQQNDDMDPKVFYKTWRARVESWPETVLQKVGQSQAVRDSVAAIEAYKVQHKRQEIKAAVLQRFPYPSSDSAAPVPES